MNATVNGGLNVTVDGEEVQLLLVDRVDGFIKVRDGRGLVLNVDLADLSVEERDEITVAKSREPKPA